MMSSRCGFWGGVMFKHIRVWVDAYSSKALLGILAGILLSVNLVSAHAAVLKDIEFATLPGDQSEITLKFDSIPPQPRGYTIEKPARIALDLLSVESSLESKYHNLGAGNARSVTVMQAKDKLRVIVNLTEMVAYQTEVDGTNLLIRVGKSATEKLVQEPAQSNEDASGPKFEGSTSRAASVKATSISQVEEIDFRRGVEGEGQVIVTLSDPTASVDLTEESGNIVVEFIGVELPEDLRRRIDVIDFATPVRTIDAITEEGNAKLIIHPDSSFEYLAYQADKQFTVSVKPVSKEEEERRIKDKFRFSGEKLSLNFQDIEVRSVLQLIADFTELNLVASDTVSGSITLRLQNVPWDQALDLILKTKGLDKRKVGNVLLVAPADEIAAREKLELETTRQVQELAPLRTEYVQINYAKAADLVSLISGEGGSGFLSSRGSATVDERTNTVLIQDTAASIEQIRVLFSKLDIPVEQVLIEARVVVANADFNKELGVSWGFAGLQRTPAVDADGEVFLNRESPWTFGGSSQTVSDLQFPDDDGTITLTRPNNLNVDLGVSSNPRASAFAIGYSSLSTGFLELELSALESDGKADIIATPKILTADQQTARIASGTEIPYREASSSGAATVAFKEAALSLEVTPQITPDGRIVMDLKVNQDTVGQIFDGIPSVDTNEVTTSVLADDGETVVLGGVFRTESVEDLVKTPFFGDLPIIGRFFRQEIKTEQKQELLIFITPKLVKSVFSQ